jgi:hypothetical protein
MAITLANSLKKVIEPSSSIPRLPGAGVRGVP